MPSLFPLDKLFQLADANPKLKDELLQCHMFDYWAEKYYRWADALREYYPTLLENWEELRFQVIGSDTASGYRAQLEQPFNNLEGTPMELDEMDQAMSFAQHSLTMHNAAIHRMIKDIEEEIVRLKWHKY